MQKQQGKQFGVFVILNKQKIRTHWPWLGGALLLLVISWPAAVFVIKKAGPEQNGAPVADSAAVQQDNLEERRNGYRVPVSQEGAAGSAQNAKIRAVRHTQPKNAHPLEKQHTTRIVSRSPEADSKRLVDDKLSMPEWDKIFNPGGTLRDDLNEKGFTGSNGVADYIDLYNGLEAEFIPEVISNGIATDMSALLSGPNLDDEVLYNGAVRAEHDIGNAYVLATIGTDEHLRVYAGVERLITDVGTFIEIEFNQNKVNLSAGAPWPIEGKRIEGDILVRMVFSNRMLQSVQLEQWHKSGFSFVNTGAGISGDSCLEMRQFMYCVGPPPIQHPVEGFEIWDEEDRPLDPVLADDFVEVGIDVDLLVGPNAKFTSVLFRTPEDIAMNNFRVFDHLAQVSEPMIKR